ncbi:hypothetical protein [Streptomyces clavuligerus]|uniref:Secreted protein n=1 Tax=Streptomyces clavuligerus TaxID=1901 RepID=B5GVW9_STRCL|nr:hypothetical protein [Streptomyces clavuligerus]EDY50465.1 hypothetical protein SSCG_03612 [Streptomyces clavuligerus]EFG03497.1 Hypothetical protein SCLAV_p0002 [Streptomyces clavuligerus]QCS09540.1 hypothetical protein CRV15_28170 [Streptomyces clavuligerus]QPJ98408.1 hypothetical protein GE265_36130 [Streptomyces clavuligerus]WDN56267.1 hypothetical protein LL058_30820 [Streptomyces clavuligerus]
MRIRRTLLIPVITTATAGLLGLAPAGTAVPPPAAEAAEPPRAVASDWSAGGEVATATCPAGTGLVGGGAGARYALNGAHQVIDDIEANAPDPVMANSWKVQVKFGQGRAVALCDPDAPTPTVVASEWSADKEVATATCPAGTNLVGGGQDARLRVNGYDNVIDGVEANAPSPDTPNSWKVQLHLGQARAFAMCTAEAPMPTVVASEWSADKEVATATCPAGTNLVGGGQDARLTQNHYGQVLDGVEANAPSPDLANSWKVQLNDGKARAFAMCTAEAPLPVVVASEWSADGQPAVATCPAGTRLTGGGQDARLRLNNAGDPIDGVTADLPDPDQPNSWRVQLHFGQARAFAMCAPTA